MDPVKVLHWEGFGFIYLLAALVVYKLLTGGINLHGLLQSKDGSTGVSPARVQMLVATLAMVATYIGQVRHQSGNALPDVSPQMLSVFGASTSVYASVKAWMTFRTR